MSGDGASPSDDGNGAWARIRRLLIRLGRSSRGERLLIALAALVLSVGVGTVLVTVAAVAATCGSPELVVGGFELCYDPLYVFDRLFLGALGDPLSPGWSPLDLQMAATLRETTILVFTGLSVAVAFQAGIFNIGTQGQLVVGALATALAVLWVSPAVGGLVGTLLLLPFGVLVGAATGGFYGAIPGALKAYADANEVITTIMLNFVATSVALYLVQDHFKDPESLATQTRTIPEYGQFPTLVYDPRLDFSILALLLGLAFVGGLYLLLSHTPFGYDIRTSGIQPTAAEYGGVDAARTIVGAMTLSGAMAGVGGAVYVLMVLGKFQTGVPSYGFDGITVSILAGNNPVGVVFAALLFGVLKSGTTVVSFATDVPPQLVGVLRGLIILFVAMPEFFRMIGRRIAPESPGPSEPRDGAESVAGGATDD
ncbi:MAG: ABC transporter permease [Halobacteriales archaeon]